MSERVRQAELARRLNVSRQAVGDLVTRGILIVGDDGLIDVDSASVAIANNVHPAGKTAAATRPQNNDQAPQHAAPPQPTAGLDYHAARTLREYTEAQRAALKLRQEIGELAPLAAIERQLKTAILDAREYLRNEPPRLAVLLDGLDRPGREDLLNKTFDEFLRRLADWKRGSINNDA
jgi:hypothetical protein